MSRPIKLKFDADRPGAARVAERQAAKLVTQVSVTTREAIRSIVVRSIREQIPPYDAARLIRSVVGLTTRQAQASMTFRADLVNRGLTLEKVNQLTDRYTAKQLRSRSLTIARTEIMEDLNKGQEEAWKQARADGWLGKDTKKEWLTADPCLLCAPMEGQQVLLDADFAIPGPPAHPRCKCSIVPVP